MGGGTFEINCSVRLNKLFLMLLSFFKELKSNSGSLNLFIIELLILKISGGKDGNKFWKKESFKRYGY